MREREHGDHKNTEIVRNQMTGTSQAPIIQAHDIAGGIHFHQARADPVAPPNLLPPRPRLVDRTELLAALHALRDEVGQAPLTVLITGPVGVGKTALSLAWAHSVHAEYPDGLLYADLRAHSHDAPTSSHAVLGDFLHALGIPPDDIPGEQARRAALYRTVTAGRRLLVLLDDAMTAAQVRPLLPASPHSVTLVTSRYRLAGLLGRGARGVYVDRLDEEASLALLADTLGEDRINQDRDAAAELVELCMRLPLALTIAAAQLAARPNRRLRELVAALAEEQGRLSRLTIEEGDMALRSALDASYRALGSGTARLYRLLGLIPGTTFSGDAVAALAGVSGPETSRGLERLIDSNMIDDTTDGRYRFHHALIRLHAAQLAEAQDPADTRSQAMTRLLDWYAATTLRADRQIRPYQSKKPQPDIAAEPVTDFGGPTDALAWLRAERANLRAAVVTAYEQGLPAVAWRLADAMWALHLHSPPDADRLLVEETGLRAARAHADRYGEAKMLNRLGLTSYDTGEYREAARYYDEALTLWRELGDRDREAGTLRRIGLVHAARGENEAAIRMFLSAHDMYRTLTSHRKAALCLIDVADLLLTENRAADALLYLRQADESMAGTDDVYNKARILTIAGRAHGIIGEIETARRKLTEALESMTEMGSAIGRARALEGLGELAEAAGSPGEAQRRYKEALDLLGPMSSTRTRIELRLSRIHA